jgi:PPOX class probable F420-dependent enzyme
MGTPSSKTFAEERLASTPLVCWLATKWKLNVMRLDAGEARELFVASDVLRLATAGIDGQPHVVPCTFAVDGSERIVIGIDNKQKSSLNLRRLRNIAENPRVSLLVDHYADDWAQLRWARADGVATVERSGVEHAEHWRLLRAKYPQYEGQALDGPVIAVRVTSWSGWSYASS